MEAIILSRRDFREYDQIISLYTKEKGKMELLVRGVKKILSKNTAHLEPCSYVEADIVPGREIDHLIRVQPIEFFPWIRSNLSASIVVQQAVSLFDTMIEVREPDQRLFQLLKSWLLVFEKTHDVHVLFLDSFVLKLFTLLGISPVVDQCVVCGKPYAQIMAQDIANGTESFRPGFYFAGGGLVCQPCRVDKLRVGEDVFIVGLKEVSDMDILLRAEWQVIRGVNMDQSAYQRMHDLIYRFVIFHSERKIGDWGKLCLS